MFPEAWEFHVRSQINTFVDWLLDNFSAVFDGISNAVLQMLLRIDDVLSAVPWWLVLVLVAAVGYFATRRIVLTIVLTLLPVFIGVFGLWPQAMETLAVIISSVIVAVVIGIPVGVVMAEIPIFNAIVKPILDGMQTMPSFVYLIPAMMFFGLGKVPAVMATVVYALPPVARLTDLGLRQVPKEVQEAALSFGATRFQLLREVRLPLAMPSILTGVNQTTMMALAMVVIASMIGARGIGEEVLRAINRIDVGRGFEAGISVVIMAIVIDRLSQGIAHRWEPPKR